jgi:hypothetical protein
MTFTPTEKGVVSGANSVTLSAANTAPYNTNTGTVVAATPTTVTLAVSASTTLNAYQNLIIEIVAGTGRTQHTPIISYSTGRVATVAQWQIIPDTTSIYVVHQNSGSIPLQLQPNSIVYLATANISISSGEWVLRELLHQVV